MKPCLNTGGNAAHWAILCGVIIGKVYRKNSLKPKDNGFLYFYDNTKKLLTPMDFISTNDIIKGTSNVGNFSDEPTRRLLNFRNRSHTNNNDNGNDRDMHVDSEIDDDNDIITERESSDFISDSDDNVTDDTDMDNRVKHNLNKYSDTVYKKTMRNVDLNDVWVIARHGKCSDYDVWSLDELSKSNQQLKLPSEKILSCFWSGENDEDTVQKLLESLSSASSSKLSQKQQSVVNTSNNSNSHTVIRYNGVSGDQSLTSEQNQEGPSSVPLPPPLPPSPSSCTLPRKNNNPNLPFILPEGVRLDQCLAQRFIIFEPVRKPNFISDIRNECYNMCLNEIEEDIKVSYYI